MKQVLGFTLILIKTQSFQNMLRLFLLIITQILFVTAFDYENSDGVLIKKSWVSILNEFEKVTNRLLKDLNLKSPTNL